MTRFSQTISLLVLRWTLGLVVIFESALFAFSPGARRELAHVGLPGWIAPTLGGIEILAALIFLIPATRRAGAYALLAVFAVAVLIHFVHGQYNVGPILVYAAAVFACMERAARSPESRI